MIMVPAAAGRVSTASRFGERRFRRYVTPPFPPEPGRHMDRLSIPENARRWALHLSTDDCIDRHTQIRRTGAGRPREENSMREHIDFIQAQNLPWQEADSFSLPGATMKLLSIDDEDHSFSCVLRLPAGWSRAAAPSVTDEEMYILEGSLEAGGERLDEHCYSFLPAGAPNGVSSKDGATLLYFRSGEVAADRRTPEAAAKRRVARIDVSSG